MKLGGSRSSHAARVVILHVETIFVVAREFRPVRISDVFNSLNSFACEVDRLDSGFGSRRKFHSSLEYLERSGNADSDDDENDHRFHDSTSSDALECWSHARFGKVL